VSSPTCEEGAAFDMSEIETRTLADGLVLISYRLRETRVGETNRITRRASIWRQREEWQIIWHQGTVVGSRELF
jgi:hypothetical protein